MTTSEIILYLNCSFTSTEAEDNSVYFLEAVSTLVPTRQSHLSDPRNADLSWYFALGTYRIFLTN